MPAKKDSSRPGPEGQPAAEIEAYAAQVTGELARLIMPLAGQLLTRPTDSPAGHYRLELGRRLRPLLEFWLAMDSQTDRFDLFRLYLAAGDGAQPLPALFTEPDFVNGLFIALTGQDAAIPDLAYVIVNRLNTVENLQQQITELAADDPENAAYLQALLDASREDAGEGSPDA